MRACCSNINGQQLHHARQLLTTTRLPIAEVAERTGFSSGEYLCVAFKKSVVAESEDLPHACAGLSSHAAC